VREFLSVIPLVPEFITPQDGSEKQDYELAASKRWLAKEAKGLPVRFIDNNIFYLT
jgi:hypothetical protein